ncbi:TetR/AcrR family transcriptional regulator [Agromyces atrinae]|uniref:TetR/AcrR family transcriptional regulator n=1 Tax=Agromyces atrinae TaxID=592376 RepID=UPI001F599A62|nr:TetR/AcrR family transcriptional regulator [Agromyces atrinae]MCI2957972.1 TetR/AcrR family transcriptional regulator [Agromyces atrinae]
MGAKLGQNNVKGEATKAAILDAAAAALAESGYRGASLAGIAERAGVTQSGLLHHFGSKEDLLLAVLDEHGRHDDALLARPLGRGGLGVIAGLRDLLAEYANDRVSVRLFVVLVAESTSPEHPGHAYMRDRYEKLRNRLVGSLLVGVDRGEFAADADLESLSTGLIALMDGVQLQWVYNSAIDMPAAFEVLATALARDLGALGSAD